MSRWRWHYGPCGHRTMSAVTKEPEYDLHSSIYLSIRKLSAVRGRNVGERAKERRIKLEKGIWKRRKTGAGKVAGSMEWKKELLKERKRIEEFDEEMKEDVVIYSYVRRKKQCSFDFPILSLPFLTSVNIDVVFNAEEWSLKCNRHWYCKTASVFNTLDQHIANSKELIKSNSWANSPRRSRTRCFPVIV